MNGNSSGCIYVVNRDRMGFSRHNRSRLMWCLRSIHGMRLLYLSNINHERDSHITPQIQYACANFADDAELCSPMAFVGARYSISLPWICVHYKRHLLPQ